jgi:hypothetical protein
MAITRRTRGASQLDQLPGAAPTSIASSSVGLKEIPAMVTASAIFAIALAECPAEIDT